MGVSCVLYQALHVRSFRSGLSAAMVSMRSMKT